jgi:hypothetical protein
LTYNVHAASTELATHEAVAFGFNPRRNRCFHSSIGKVVRPLAASARRTGSLVGPRSARCLRSTHLTVSSRRQRSSADRWAPRMSRAAVRRPIKCGLVTTFARRTFGGLPARAE